VTGFFDYPAGGPDPFLARATDRDWALLREHLHARRHPAGAVITAAGDTDRALLLLVEGPARAGAGRRAAPLRPGAVTGELAFLTGRPAAEEVRAETDVLVLRLPLAGFEALAARDPALGRYLLFDLARLLAERAAALRGLADR
jgi:CRP-like cAMP-binding protein